MILAGIDEAGYGPLLGPLVVGCCAFRVDGADPAEIPCLWKLLHRTVSKKKTAGGKKLHINDSKVVYTPAAGLSELERSVLALLSSAHGPITELNELLTLAAGHAREDLQQHPWYRPLAVESFPLDQSAAAVQIAANALSVEMRRTGTACVHYSARVISERRFNAMSTATRNKASTLFSVTAIHLDQLLSSFAHEQLTIVCDRQGGRQHYGSLLRLMFEEWSLEVTFESEPMSEYRLKRDGREVRILFCEQGEKHPCRPPPLPC